MKFGVLSDIHSNYEALCACIKHFEKEKVDKYILCGDIIGYGPDPELCIKKIQKLPLEACVLGNHDAAILYPKLEELFNEEARIALAYNKNLITKSSFNFISKLPNIHVGENYTVVHGTPREPVTEYFCNTMQFKDTYSLWKGHVCFVGHTHVPFYISGTKTNCHLHINKQDALTMRLSQKKKFVINPGAVGKPRDNNSKLSAGIWDTQANTFTSIRIQYDFSVTQQKMEKLHFPAFLIDSLTLGL